MRLITCILIVVDDSQNDVIGLIWCSDARGEFNNLGGLYYSCIRVVH